MHCTTIVLCRRAPKYRSSLFAFVVGAVTFAAPYTLYSAQYFDALVKRFGRHFDTLAYLNDQTLSVFEKLREFVTLYLG